MPLHITAKRQRLASSRDFPIVESTTLGYDAKARTCANSAIAASRIGGLHRRRPIEALAAFAACPIPS